MAGMRDCFFLCQMAIFSNDFLLTSGKIFPEKAKPQIYPFLTIPSLHKNFFSIFKLSPEQLSPVYGSAFVDSSMGRNKLK